MPTMTQRWTGQPLLAPTALSGGSLPSRDLDLSRAFYEQVLGLDVREGSSRLVVRLGYAHCYVVEKVPADKEMSLLSHNGVYVLGDIDEAYRHVLDAQARFGIKRVTKPALQHGSLGFFLQDRDGNWWEVNRSVAGPSENFLPDLTGGPDMTAEEVRSWFAARGDILFSEDRAQRQPARPEGQAAAALPTTHISHGTLESRNIHESRRFYEAVLGLDVKQLTPVSLAVGLGTDHRYAVVAPPQATPDMPHFLRNRLLFSDDASLAEAHRAVESVSNEWHITDITGIQPRPGGQFFEIRDADRNWWELYTGELVV